MTDSLTIHRYKSTQSEVTSLRQISGQFALDSGTAWQFDDILKVVSHKGQLYYIGEEHWIATAVVTIAEHQADLLYIYVRPEHRRTGVGKRLISELAESLRSQGVGELFLEVRVGNTGAIALYERSGFSKIAVRKRYYADGEDAYVYRWYI